MYSFNSISSLSSCSCKSRQYVKNSHLEFRFRAIILASINIFVPNLTVRLMENQQPKGTYWSLVRLSKIQDGIWPPCWISIFGHNFGVEQHFCTKFGTVMENQKPEGTYWSLVRFSKIQDGGRPRSWISILVIDYDSVVDWDICTKFCMVIQIKSVISAVCAK